MKTLYLDLLSGISGDMFVGALIDLGVDFKHLESQLQLLHLDGYHLHCGRGQKSQISGVKFDVHISAVSAPGNHAHEHTHSDGTSHAHPHDHGHDPHHTHDHPHHHSPAHDDHGHAHTHAHAHAPVKPVPHLAHRTFADIRRVITESALSDWVKSKALAVFQRIADAEGRIHGVPPAEVHFHEVGAVDSIVDIVGACVALEQLGKPRVLASPVVDGTGWIHCAHGRFPVPAPATLAILAAREIPISQCDEPHEMVTPTGAALLAEFAESFGPMNDLRAIAVGYGLGTRDLKTRPNLLRVLLAQPGSDSSHHRDWEIDTIVKLEANIDDATPEILGHFLQRAMHAGALDVCHAPIQMKKNRPGIMLTVLCRPEQTDQFAQLILTETTAFGLRIHEHQRRKLKREIVAVSTPFGEVQVKLGRLNGRVVQAAPEYDSACAIADQHKIPLATVYAAAMKQLQIPKP